MKKITLLCCTCFAVLLARSQWTTPDASNNINNTNTGGLVGIGTTTPVTMLDVNGSFHTANNTPVIPPSEGVGGLTVLWNRSGGQAEVNFYNVFNNAITAYVFSQKTGATTYSDLMWIGGNGNVGIGTSNTGSNRLAVEGTIGARKMVVTLTNPFPDYVFDKGYKFPSLDSLADYIRAYHHLPDIPSADSMSRSGLDLGGNQTVLLRKIEELTLYILGQNNMIKTQAQRLEEQDKQLKSQEARFEKLEKMVAALQK